MIALREAIKIADSVNSDCLEMYKEDGDSLIKELEQLQFRLVSKDIAKSLLSRILLSRESDNPQHIVDGFNFSNEAYKMGTELGLKDGFFGEDVALVDMDMVCKAIIRGALPVTRQIN